MSGELKTRSHTTKRTIYGAIQAVTAKIAAAVLKPAAQTSNFDASPASPRSHAARRSIGCRRGPRSSFATLPPRQEARPPRRSLKCVPSQARGVPSDAVFRRLA